MPKPRLILALAKVMIAAAWIDGQVSTEELNSLKDLLFHLPGMTARDWAELEIYIETPVGPDERARLIAELQSALANRRDRGLAISALQDLIQADGQVSERESAIFEEIRQSLEEVGGGIFGQLGRLVGGSIERRAEAVDSAPNRELYLEDFIRNKIYYHLKQRLHKDDLELNLPDSELRKLSLAGGLLARVAYVDREVTEAEFEHMAEVLQTYLELEPEAASFVAEVAVSTVSRDLDYYRLSREFFEATTEPERLHFLDALFAVAAADGRVSHHEMEEIKTISRVLKLAHKQFIDAKLKIPRQQRAY